MIISKNKIGIVEYAIAAIIAGIIIFGLANGNELVFVNIIQKTFGFVISFLFLCWLVRTPLGVELLDENLRALMLFGLICSFTLISMTTVFFKASDINGHFGYVETLYRLHIPNTKEGWQTYQPPLYYLIAVPFYAIGKNFDLPQPFEFVRYLSVICHLIFLLFSIGIMQRIVESKRLVYIGLLLLTLWPAGLVYSGKVNNDILITVFFTAGIYYLLKWFQQATRNDLYYAMIAAILAVAVKSTGVLLCAVIAAMFILKLVFRKIKLRDQIKFSTRQWVILVALVLVCFGVNFGRTYYYRIVNDDSRNYLVGNMTNANYDNWKAAYIEDDNINYYVIFDAVTFVEQPYLALYFKDEGGRRYFWNTYFKTMILSFDGWKAPLLGSAVSLLFLLTLIYTAAGTITLLIFSRQDRKNLIVPLVIGCAGAAGQIYMRLTFPVTGFGENRYSFFVVPIILAAFMRSIEWQKQSRCRPVAYIGLFLAVALAAVMAIFILAQHV